ncbi:MAG: hypothetical protein FJ291_29625 [Planctomycetes bacterium]|nr:hypothetical protein [Planctomycetota bacterium]
MAGEAALPKKWLGGWNQPPLADRPLQIIHGFNPAKEIPDGLQQMLSEPATSPAEAKRTRYFNDLVALGLGGVVANVAFKDYLRSEESWQALVAGVETCAKLGMFVWLYDEDGYPSGAAGGLVLKENPAFEASELAFDPSLPDPFVVRPAYEFTHASNNYYAARRYVNLLDDRATRAFIAKTHDAYWSRLRPHFGKTIQATFTDEPSLIAINLGQIPEPARKRVRTVDPLDPAAKPLPCVPWVHDLPRQYKRRYGEDLLAQRRSLFEGDSPDDRRVRGQFWALVADLAAERYFAPIQAWCRRHRIASSGHILWEEAVMHHVPLDGNHLKMLSLMDIPGLDVLSSDPEVVLHGGWLAAALPASAAMLTGGRRVMTEVSDFVQTQGGQGPAALPEMQATAAWQAALGVTDFTLYYRIADRPAEATRAYGDFIGRLNAILKPARLAPSVLLYYPIRDLWAEYRPVAEPLRLESQSPKAQRIVRSFNRLGQALLRGQVPFALTDHEFLANARVLRDGTLAMRDQRFGAIVLPQDTELLPDAARVVERFRTRGGKVLTDTGQLASQALCEALRPAFRLTPASDRIVLGRFIRDEREIVLLVNVGRQPYSGTLSAQGVAGWLALDPATGAVTPSTSEGGARLSLAPRQALLLVLEQGRF